MDQHISLKLIRLALPLGDKSPLDLLLLYFDSVGRQHRKIQAYLFGLCRIHSIRLPRISFNCSLSQRSQGQARHTTQLVTLPGSISNQCDIGIFTSQRFAICHHVSASRPEGGDCQPGEEDIRAGTGTCDCQGTESSPAPMADLPGGQEHHRSVPGMRAGVYGTFRRAAAF